MKPVTPAISPDQRPDQEAQPLSPESLANNRFINLFQRIISERAITAEPENESDHGKLKLCLLPRIPGWEPDKTKWEDIENAINRIFITESSDREFDPLNYQEVLIYDFDAEDSSRYWEKRFKIVGDKVGVAINHMRVNPAGHEPRTISSQEIEQAPPELLEPVVDEIERILSQQSVA